MHLDKVINYKIHDTKKTTYIDEAVKQKAFMPEPYDVAGSLINSKKNSSLCKGVRMTLPLEIENLSKKEVKPGPGAYEPRSKTHLLGAFNLKSEKVSFIEDAQYAALQSPSSYTLNYSQVHSKVLNMKLAKPKESAGTEKYKIVKNDKPSPTSYESHLAYKSTQRKTKSFLISQTKNLNLVD